MILRRLNSYRPSLRLSLACLLVSLVVLTAVALGLATYFRARAAVWEGIRDRLHDAVATGVLLIDGDAHRRVQSRADENTPEYRAIQAQLRRIRDNCLQVRFVYTMRRSAAGKDLFIVDAEEDTAELSHVGDVYEGEFCAGMEAAFTPPHQVQVAPKLTEDEWGVWLTSYAPIFTGTGEFDGLLAMDMSAASIRQVEQRCLVSILAITALICLLAAAFAILLSRRVSRPLLLLAKDMESIRLFRLEQETSADSRIREISDMAHAVHNMKSGLRSFRRYVPADLVAELIRQGREAVPGGERRVLTTLFSDIRDFSTIAEALPPEVLAGNLSTYFGSMTRTILEHHGTVDKFIGDAIMAFWGAPNPVEEPALLACRAALACQRLLLDLNAQWQQHGMPALETRIGINTGEAIVGNMGYEERLCYTAFGDSVNLASRAENLNKRYGTCIILTENTLRLLTGPMVCRWLDRIAVKGRRAGVDIYELLAEGDTATPEQLRLVATVDRAKERYLGRDWQAARDAFAAALALVPEDTAAAVLAQRCDAFLSAPPPADWDGVTVMREK